MKYLAVKNWENYQHYKNKTAVWIKFYMSLLDDPEFRMLDDASKKLLPLLFLCAGVYRNCIPNDEKVIRKRLTLVRKIDLNPLIISGFLIPMSRASLEPVYNDSIERREEKRREDKKGDKKMFGGMESHFKNGFLSERDGSDNPIGRISRSEHDLVSQLLTKLPEDVDVVEAGRRFWQYVAARDGQRNFLFALENHGNGFVTKPKKLASGSQPYSEWKKEHGYE